MRFSQMPEASVPEEGPASQLQSMFRKLLEPPDGGEPDRLRGLVIVADDERTAVVVRGDLAEVAWELGTVIKKDKRIRAMVLQALMS